MGEKFGEKLYLSRGRSLRRGYEVERGWFSIDINYFFDIKRDGRTCEVGKGFRGKV